MGLVKCVALNDMIPGENIVWPVDGKSLTLTTSESLLALCTTCVHLKNTFTVACWVRTPTSGSQNVMTVNAQNIATILNATTWQVVVRALSPPAANPFIIFKNYSYSSLTASTWYHLVYTINVGNSQELSMYVNGVNITSTITPATNVAIGGNRIDLPTTLITSISGGSGAAPGYDWHSLAIWNSVLNDKAITQIYNNGNETFNLLKNKGKYGKKKKLRHWWVPELTPYPLSTLGGGPTGDLFLGRDYGRAGYLAIPSKNEGLNMLDSGGGVSAADDLVGSTPSGR